MQIRILALIGAFVLTLSTPAFSTNLIIQDQIVADTSKSEIKKNDKKKKWDVTAVHGPTDSVKFTTTEGTWMNLDVSPDGNEIVFDLLGDIFTIPITGGDATLVSGGPAFDVQPRYSPDGSKISFTSDRAGGDNIWIMNRDGSDAKQISKEKFRLLNNATWTPDGNYLIARKHFTSTRSIGAGEMWMFHIPGGGGGLQVTKRKNDQQDAGEPVVSPDGRYLYFSEDMSGGKTFQYNKNPYGQIYVIRRLDMETGKLTNYITGPGGAIRPQVSPDGKYLSFVRRVRLKNVLYVHDIETFEQWPVYDNLSKDQQETWAIFGPHPNYSWTPDSKYIVVWAKGKIWNINIETKSANEIPFRARVEHKITSALHFTYDPDPESFDVKMMRDVTTSPDGNWIVFGAIGKLWKKKMPNGNAERLSKDQNSEFYPAFSPDGKWIVYTTWSDQELGAIHKIKMGGGKSTQLTQRKGYYHTPSFSPDGKKIVYRRSGGNSLLGFSYSTKRGLYWISSDGGQVSLITESGRNPRFSEDGNRIYYLSGGGLEKKYKSIGIDGKDERTVFDLKYTNGIVPSPDGKWVAFTELFNAYIAPFPRTGKSISLNKDTKAIPIKRVTRDAGNYLHWSGDSQKLHWSIGPEYYTRELRESFQFIEGAPDSLPKPDTTGFVIQLNIKTDVPTGKIALIGARIISMKGDEVIENGTIVIDQNRIIAVGRDVQIPADAKRIDVSGKTIMPGMVDVHAHTAHFTSGVLTSHNWAYYANLAFGVTTVHDPSANTETVFTQSEMVKAGKMVGPRVFSTGTILYGADGAFKAVVNSLDDARSHLRRMKAIGAISVKSYNQPRRDQRQQIIQAARELEMLVVPEGGSTFFHNINMILDGHTGIEHSIPIAPLYNDVISLWGASKTAYTPTFVVAYGGLSGEYYWYQNTNVWENERLLNFVPRAFVDARSRRRVMAHEDDFNHIDVAKAANKLRAAGVNVHIGAHGQLQGLADHWEIWMMVQGGFTPLQAIRGATLHGAQYLGMDKDLGSLEVGKLADLVVLEKNPLENIRNTEFVKYVMINGRLYDAETMNEIGNHPKTRPPFYWENPKTSEAYVWRGEEIGFREFVCSCRQ
ncbi:PD40 domain-containing protein [candidate division KSB1 bacterium]|nr:PD40 domain-containing protein [candidate division KSB1 bacterium]